MPIGKNLGSKECLGSGGEQQSDTAGRCEAHPDRASSFGVVDMAGSVRPWTDEFLDKQTRTAILRKKRYCQPQGFIWYFSQGHCNDKHGKLILMVPGYDRAETVGSRGKRVERTESLRPEMNYYGDCIAWSFHPLRK
jgi:hypothetical protein